MIYLDYSATTPVLKEVLDSYNKVTIDYFGNPNSLHSLGVKSRELLNSATKQISNIFKIKEFYTNKDKKYDKYSAILSPLQIINADGTYKFDESDSAEVKGSIKNGFCTKETQKECLEAFKAEFVRMVEAVDALLDS